MTWKYHTMMYADRYPIQFRQNVVSGEIQMRVDDAMAKANGYADLAELKGKVVLLNFWATWCPPCRQELARVQSDVIDRFAGRDFVFLPISRGETHQTVAAFREKTGYSFPMGLDPSQTVYDRYASNYIPRNFVIDRNGKVVLASVGYDPEEFDEMIKTIEKTLE